MPTNLQNYSAKLKVSLVKLFQLIFRFLMFIRPTPIVVAVADNNCHVDYV